MSTIEDKDARFLRAMFSPDGRVLASAGLDGRVRLWKAESMKPIRVLDTGDNEAVRSIAFFPGHEALASASGPVIRLWNLVDGTCEGRLEGHTRYVDRISFSPDGKKLASISEDETIRLWDMATLECERVIDARDDWPLFVVFSPKGNIIVSGGIYTKEARLWNPESGEMIGVLRHRDSVWDATFSPNGDLFATASSNVVTLWAISSRKRLFARRTLMKLHMLRLSKVERILEPSSSAYEGYASYESCRQWWKYLRSKRRWDSGVQALVFSPHADFILSGHRSGLVRIWNAKNGKLVKEFRSHSYVLDLAIAPSGGEIASVGIDVIEDREERNIKLWRIDRKCVGATLSRRPTEK